MNALRTLWRRLRGQCRTCSGPLKPVRIGQHSARCCCNDDCPANFNLTTTKLKRHKFRTRYQNLGKSRL